MNSFRVPKLIWSVLLSLFLILASIPVSAQPKFNDDSDMNDSSIVNRSFDNWGTVEAAGACINGDSIIYSFCPSTSGTFWVETHANVGGDEQDTVVRVYSSTWSLIAQNDDVSSYDAYSAVCFNAIQGNLYYVEISYLLDNMNPECYLIIYLEGSLLLADYFGDAEDYVSLMENFNKLDDATTIYNCLAYAVGVYDEWYWIGGESEQATIYDFDVFLGDYEYDYSEVPSYRENCIIVYGSSKYDVLHFAKSEYYNISAKLGSLELVTHDFYDVYYPYSYGSPVAYYEPNFTDKKCVSEPIFGAETNILDFSGYADCTVDDMKLKGILSSYKFLPYDGLTLYSQVDRNKEMYSAILELGQPVVPYLLKTVFASEQNGAYEGFLTYCAYALSNAEGYMLEDECSGNTFSKHTSKYYAYNLWYNLNMK